MRFAALEGGGGGGATALLQRGRRAWRTEERPCQRDFEIRAGATARLAAQHGKLEALP